MSLQSHIWFTSVNGVEFRYYKFDGRWCVGRRDGDAWELIADDLQLRGDALAVIARSRCSDNTPAQEAAS